MEQILTIDHEEDSMHGRFLTFNLDNDVFGIEIRFVTEIISVQTITKIPEVPGYIMGVINLRGKIVPVIDMRLKFKKELVAYDDRTCIIVVETNNILAGLIVDSVAEVLTINEGNISLSASYEAGFHNEYILGIGRVNNEVKLILDCEKLFSADIEGIPGDDGSKAAKKSFSIN
jgi:purine-binding chemotaxis protein CheW